jgi:alkylhydroperoxidase family enzyme
MAPKKGWRFVAMTTAKVTEARMEFAEFDKAAPEARAALSALSKAVGDSGLDKGLTELIKIRASQINSCAFCVQSSEHDA